MCIIRKAGKADRDAIDSIIEEMNLFQESVSVDNFWVGEKDGEVIAVAQLEDLGDEGIISCLGVKPSHRRKGIASKLLGRMIDGTDGDIYLFTVMPDFFEGVGFEEAAPTGSARDYRRNLNCAACEPEKCVCMKFNRGTP